MKTLRILVDPIEETLTVNDKFDGTIVTTFNITGSINYLALHGTDIKVKDSASEQEVINKVDKEAKKMRKRFATHHEEDDWI